MTYLKTPSLPFKRELQTTDLTAGTWSRDLYLNAERAFPFDYDHALSLTVLNYHSL